MPAAIRAQTFSDNFYAASLTGLPKRINVRGDSFCLSETLKNDFFAVTGVYTLDSHQTGKDTPEKIVLKMGRCRSFFGLPLKWLGAMMCRHEVRMLSLVHDIAAVPHVYAHYGKFGFVYEYIPGASLDENVQLDKNFFNQLRELLNDIHDRGMVYLDLNKRGNIIVGKDGKPRLIDFQISRQIKKSFLLPALSEYIRKQLQKADIYHLYKHKKKLQPHLLTTEEFTIYKKRPFWIQLHRLIANPFRTARRSLLRFLYNRCGLIYDSTAKRTPETDPGRWVNLNERK